MTRGMKMKMKKRGMISRRMTSFEDVKETSSKLPLKATFVAPSSSMVVREHWR